MLLVGDIKATNGKTADSVIYTVKKGETLWSITIMHYGSGEFYSEIAQANNLYNPSLIHAGDKIILPPLGTDRPASDRPAGGWYPLRDASTIKSVDDIYTGVEYTIPKLPSDHPVRFQLEKDLEQDIEEHIVKARTGGNKQAAKLLLTSMQARPDDRSIGFASWMGRRGRALGAEECYRIGIRVTSDMKFTTKEAEEIINKQHQTYEYEGFIQAYQRLFQNLKENILNSF